MDAVSWSDLTAQPNGFLVDVLDCWYSIIDWITDACTGPGHSGVSRTCEPTFLLTWLQNALGELALIAAFEYGANCTDHAPSKKDIEGTGGVKKLVTWIEWDLTSRFIYRDVARPENSRIGRMGVRIDGVAEPIKRSDHELPDLQQQYSRPAGNRRPGQGKKMADIQPPADGNRELSRTFSVKTEPQGFVGIVVPATMVEWHTATDIFPHDGSCDCFVALFRSE